jgi:hypothetical protein
LPASSGMDLGNLRIKEMKV